METPPPTGQPAATWWDEVPAALGRGGLWSRPIGLALGLLAVGAVTALLLGLERLGFAVPSYYLFYLPPIALLAYGWGGRVGAATAGAAFLATWFLFIPPRFPLTPAAPGDWARLALIGVSYLALALLGDAVRRLRRANDQLETIIASIADGVLVIDGRGELIQTNGAMRRMLGGEVPRTLAERNARWRTRAIAGPPVEPGSGPTGLALRGITSTGTELLINTPDGRDLPVSVSGAPLRGRGGQVLGAVIVCRDIGEMRRLQQAKDDFLSVASHELKTPLTALSGYAQMLRQRMTQLGTTDERALRYLGALEAQSRRMGELVNSLLDMSRLDAGSLQLRRAPCDLAALVRTVARQLDDLSARHTLAVAGAERLVGAWDADRIEQVVVNLLTNAIRYSPNGGPIAITVGTVADLPADAAPPTPPDAPAAFVRVRDQGLGLAPDQLDAIFGRFQRADADAGDAEARRGMGLGLYISREIVARHGGLIWAESPGPGQGATFTFTLPLAVEAGCTGH